MSSIIFKGNEAERRYKQELERSVEFLQEIDLQTIFNPKTLFASLKLTNAKKIDRSSVDLDFYSGSGKLYHKSNCIILKISSLEIDGALFDDKGRVTLNAGTSTSPDFYVTFDEGTGTEEYQKQIDYLPLYSDRSRESFICNLKIASGEESEKILLSGAALIVPDFMA